MASWLAVLLLALERSQPLSVYYGLSSDLNFIQKQANLTAYLFLGSHEVDEDAFRH